MIDIELIPAKAETGPLLQLLEEEWERQASSRISYPGYRLVEKGLGTAEQVADAINRTRKMCLNAGVPVHRHFREVYICNGERVFRSWMLSELALKLTIVHIESDSPLLAHLQINMLR